MRLADSCWPPAGQGTGADTNEVAEYLNSLPRWEQANPLEVPVDDQDIGPEVVSEEPVADFLNAENGESGPATLICSERLVKLKDNAAELVTFDSTAGVIWPGALIQGSSRTGTTSELKPFIVDPADRAPIKLALWDITVDGSNAIEVAAPGPSAVNDAKSQLLVRAIRDDIGSPTAINFTIETFNSQEEFAFNQGFSGSYLSFEGNASVGYKRSSSENSVVAYFVERMYTVTVDPPSSPSAWFKPGFTKEELDQKIAAGEIGPNNLPVYVASVTYGRIMMATFTASTDAESLKASVELHYDSFFSSATSTTELEWEEVISRSSKAWKFWGGNSEGARNAILNADVGAYFVTDVKLSDALPISFTLNTMRGQLAEVTETTEYMVRDCKMVTNADYAYLPSAELAVDLPRHARDAPGRLQRRRVHGSPVGRRSEGRSAAQHGGGLWQCGRDVRCAAAVSFVLPDNQRGPEGAARDRRLGR